MYHAGSKNNRLRVVSTLVAAVAVVVTCFSIRLQAAESQALSEARSLSGAFRAAAAQVKPTVVQIRTATNLRPVRSERGGVLRESPFNGDRYDRTLGDEQARRFLLGQSPLMRRQGVGSGVIVDQSGIILTNNHVVSGADEVWIELMDGRQYQVIKKKGDPQTDLAVLWIEADGPLPAAKLGDSDELETGDWVLAVGSPFGLEQTVSAGIISGKGRALPDGKRTEFLQTDAAINPGNSGGPLVSLAGEVVGINTAIASSSGGYQGVGFAIPSNLAHWIKNQLVENGAVRRSSWELPWGRLRHVWQRS